MAFHGYSVKCTFSPITTDTRGIRDLVRAQVGQERRLTHAVDVQPSTLLPSMEMLMTLVCEMSIPDPARHSGWAERIVQSNQMVNRLRAPRPVIPLSIMTPLDPHALTVIALPHQTEQDP